MISCTKSRAAWRRIFTDRPTVLFYVFGINSGWHLSEFYSCNGLGIIYLCNMQYFIDRICSADQRGKVHYDFSSFFFVFILFTGAYLLIIITCSLLIFAAEALKMSLYGPKRISKNSKNTKTGSLLVYTQKHLSLFGKYN